MQLGHNSNRAARSWFLGGIGTRTVLSFRGRVVQRTGRIWMHVFLDFEHKLV